MALRGRRRHEVPNCSLLDGRPAVGKLAGFHFCDPCVTRLRAIADRAKVSLDVTPIDPTLARRKPARQAGAKPLVPKRRRGRRPGKNVTIAGSP